MDKKLFATLLESVEQANEIVTGAGSPSREFFVDRESSAGFASPTSTALAVLPPATSPN